MASTDFKNTFVSLGLITFVGVLVLKGLDTWGFSIDK
jgi:hypothetical protein